MLNRKRIIAGLMCGILCIMTACSASDKTAGEASKEPQSTEKADDNSGGLYTEALKDGKAQNQEIADDKESGRTFEAVKGVFEKRQFAIGQICYEDLEYETIPANEGELVEFLVEKGDEVHKGDKILEYKCVYDEAEQKRMTLEVENMEKDYQAGYDSRNAEINMAEHELGKLTDKTERKIKKLEIEKLKHSLNSYEGTKKKVIEARKNLDEYLEGNKSGFVKAEHDGYIIDLYRPQDDANYSKDQVVAVISKKESYHIEAEDMPKGGPRYNSEVEIVVEGSKGEENVSMKGIVMSANNIQSATKMQGMAYVKIIDEPAGVNWNNPIKVYYQYLSVSDAIMIPLGAVQMETAGGGTEVNEVPYVYVYKDNVPQKRYIKIADENNEYYRIAEGIEEGDKLVVFN